MTDFWKLVNMPLKLALTLAVFCLGTQVGFAQGKKAGPKGNVGNSAPSGHLGEAKKVKVKYKDKTEVDFDDANIDGAIKNPFASMLSTRDQDFNKGFVQLRYNWHDHMVMNVSGMGQ